jgi:peroxiredoxin
LSDDKIADRYQEGQVLIIANEQIASLAVQDSVQSKLIMADSRWAKHLLTIVGVYYLLSGLFNSIFPKVAFKVANMDVPSHLFVWQHVSILFAVLGFGFLIAASNPTRYWPIILMGILKMGFGIGGFTLLLVNGYISMAAGLHVLLADGIWFIPMIAVLRWTFKQNMLVEESLNYLVMDEDPVALSGVIDQNGLPIQSKDSDQPVLFIFLRHFGCVFCKETLSVLKREHKLIEKLGTKLVIVHMSDESEAAKTLTKYGLENLSRVSDSQFELYKQFGLEKGEMGQLINLKGILRMVDLFLFKGISQSKSKGDPHQMPGAFLVQNGLIINAFKHETASDNPDYIRLAAVPEF